MLYTQADNDLRKAVTTADNRWRNDTARAWGNQTTGDLVARGNVRRTLANGSNLMADKSQASIAELKAKWWQGELPNYLQWSVDVGAIETTYTNSTTANTLSRATGVKNAGVTYASTVGTTIQTYETTTATARAQYLTSVMSSGETAAEAKLKAGRDKEIALANADLQKQLTGNETAYATAVNNANSAYETATTTAAAALKSAKQTALSQLNSALAQSTKDKDTAIAGSERTYDQLVAALDAQYGASSSNGDTGIEGARRQAAISTRDAQYYASRDTSWAGTLSGSTTIGNTPWTLKAIASANAQAAYSINRAIAQAAHDAALLSAIDSWQISNRSSTLSLLLAEGQSREAYNKAIATVFANWEMGVGNLLGDTPEGTGYVPVRGFGEGGVGTWGGAGGGVFTRFEEGEDETTTSGEEVENVEPSRPTLPAPESNDSQPLIITVTDSPNDPPGAGEWLLERGRVVESCLSGKTLYCVGEWRATDSQSRNFLAEKVRIDQLRREFEDIASRHNFLRIILKGDAIEELGGEKVYLENRPGFSPYVITNVIEGRLIKQLWVRSPRPGSMGKVVYTNWLMVPGEISNSDLAHIYENHLDTVEGEAATQVLIDVLMQVGGELIALRMAKVIGPGGAAAKSTQILDNVNNLPLEKVVADAPNRNFALNVVEGSQTAPAKFVRQVRPGEAIADLIAEGKSATWVNEAEHAVLSLAGKGRIQRVVVSGGRDGISFIERNGKLFFEMDGQLVEVRRVLGHTHPRATGPSQGDLDVLGILGQRRSYIFEIGGEPSGTLIRPK